MDLSPSQFKKLSDLVLAECGIHLHDGKRQLLQARLSRRLRATGIATVEAYLRKIKDDPEERVRFMDAVTTNHTFFFRESHHFDCLNPEHQRIWSAASSSGEEPYSIAIHCLEKGFCPNIWATDISTHVLETAKRGIYPQERVAQIPRPLLTRYFKKGFNRFEGRVKVKQELQRMVAFQRFNLKTESPPAREFDAVFCRNVLIYFDEATKQRVVQMLYSSLRPGGLLIIGGAESLNMLAHRFRYVKPSIYRK